MKDDTVDSLLENARKTLENCGIGTARLDSLVLLQDATGKNKAWILANPDFVLDSAAIKNFMDMIERRAKQQPVAYIRGYCEFYGRRFDVNQAVLIPRPESETMIEILLAVNSAMPINNVFDIGTGSGALAITAGLELPGKNIFATDIDAESLRVAKKNALLHHSKIHFFQGDLITAIQGSPRALINNSDSIVLANLPYVPDNFGVNDPAKKEPKHAIFGGKDGLDVYRQLFEQLSTLGAPANMLLTECLPAQQQNISAIANYHGFRAIMNKDFIQLFGPANFAAQLPALS